MTYQGKDAGTLPKGADHLQNIKRTREPGDTAVTQPRSYDVHGYTYFIRDGDAIKIGSSMRPKDRIDSIQTGSSRQIETLAIVPIAIVGEFETHQKFAHLRIRGEWFRVDPELLAFIESLPSGPTLEQPRPTRQPPAPQRKSAQSSEIKAMSGKLAKIRDAHGADSEIGGRCSNILEQLVELPDYVRPEWATDERQALPYMIKKQTEALERLRRAFQ
jgi:Meiotically Up-regulated Gene 113 (MUG113) protein